jgi:hypothetical protein
VLFGPDVLGTLEHDVLEQVGEAVPSGALVLGADVVDHLQVDDRYGVVLVQQDAQAVAEPVLADLQLRRLDLEGRRGGPQTGDGEERQYGGEETVS